MWRSGGAEHVTGQSDLMWDTFRVLTKSPQGTRWRGGEGVRAGFPRWFIRLCAISFSLERNFVLLLRTPIPPPRPQPRGRTLATVRLKTHTNTFPLSFLVAAPSLCPKVICNHFPRACAQGSPTELHFQNAHRNF